MKNVRQARLAAGLTQQELADRVGTSRSQIAQIEIGNRRLTRPMAEKIAAGIGAPKGSAKSLLEGEALLDVMRGARKAVKAGLSTDRPAEMRKAAEALLQLAEHPTADAEVRKAAAKACRTLVKDLEKEEKRMSINAVKKEVTDVTQQIADAQYESTGGLLEVQIGGVFDFLRNQPDEWLERFVAEAGRELAALVNAAADLTAGTPGTPTFAESLGALRDRIAGLTGEAPESAEKTVRGPGGRRLRRDALGRARQAQDEETVNAAGLDRKYERDGLGRAREVPE